jgi:predicted TIM-barrel fold metal-dependent hydrolase
MSKTIQLIDADAHVNPPATFWDDYLPAQLRDRAPKIQPGAPGEDCDWVVFEGTRKPLGILSAVAGRKVENYRATGRREDQRRGNWEPSARLADMDIDGVDSAVLFGGGPLGTADNELYLASFSAYNRWLADFCSHDRRRLVGAAYLPMQDVGQSVAMLKDASARGLKAVNIPAFPQSAKGVQSGGFAAQTLALTGDPDGPRQYDDPEFNPFWQAAIEHDMPITIHLGARIARPGVNRFLPNLVMSKVSMAEPIAIMIFGGVFERYPRLRFGSIESGVGWFAWMAEYMDAIWHNQRHWTNNSLSRPPSFYMDQNVYGSFIRDPIGVANRHLPGGRNIMWSTDYPHSETTWPNSRDVMERNFAGVSEEERRPIVHDIAKTFYGL